MPYYCNNPLDFIVKTTYYSYAYKSVRRLILQEKLSKSLEDYLEAILIIKKQKDEVRVKDLMNFFHYKVSSVNQAIKQLKAKGLVEQERYGSIKLSKEGEFLAKSILKKHKVLVDFLTFVLGIDPKIAEYDACSFEHFIHEETFKKFKRLTKFFKKNLECLGALKEYLGEKE